MFTSSHLLHYATKLYILQIFSIVNSTVQLFYFLLLRCAISYAIMIAHSKMKGVAHVLSKGNWRSDQVSPR